MNKKKIISLIVAFAVFFTIILLPQPEGLSIVGQNSLAIFAIAIILWITEPVSFTVSAFIILALISIFVGLGPLPDDPGTIVGAGEALEIGVSGFASTSFWLVAAALFIAAAMKKTGLHNRIALRIMSRTGTKINRLVLGIILVSTVLAFIVPSATARAGAIVPIVLGIIDSLGGAKENKKLTAMLLITAIMSISFWNVGIMTAAAQNLVAIDFLTQQVSDFSLTWLEWFIYGAPWAIIMNIILYFLMPRLFKVEIEDKETDVIEEEYKDLGDVSTNEKKLTGYMIALLILWVTEGFIHPIGAEPITIIIFTIMILPVIGVYDWEDVESGTNWGTLIVFAVGISMGNLLLEFGGAEWLTSNTLEPLGLGEMPVVVIIAILSLVNIFIHLGFASATSLSSAFIPIVISLVSSMGDVPFDGVGLVIIQQFVISFGFILPVNSPQNMLAYGTDGYTGSDLLKAGIPITIIGYILIIVMSVIYWPLVGLL